MSLGGVVRVGYGGAEPHYVAPVRDDLIGGAARSGRSPCDAPLFRRRCWQCAGGADCRSGWLGRGENRMTGSIAWPRVAGVNSRIFRAAAAVAVAGGVVKIAATFKEFAVAGVYGRSDAMDAFLTAFLIP